MSAVAFNLRLLLLFGLGFLLSLIIVAVIIVCIVRIANKRKPVKQNYTPPENVTPPPDAV